MLVLGSEFVVVVVDVTSVVCGGVPAGEDAVAIGEEEAGEQGPTENHGQLQPIVAVVE